MELIGLPQSWGMSLVFERIQQIHNIDFYPSPGTGKGCHLHDICLKSNQFLITHVLKLSLVFIMWLYFMTNTTVDLAKMLAAEFFSSIMIVSFTDCFNHLLDDFVIAGR